MFFRYPDYNLEGKSPDLQKYISFELKDQLSAGVKQENVYKIFWMGLSKVKHHNHQIYRPKTIKGKI